MNRTGFVANVVFALIMSLLGALLFLALGMWFASGIALLLVVGVLAGCYLAWLLYSHRCRGGVALVMLTWLGVAATLLLVGAGVLLPLLVFSSLVWMTRSYLRYRKPLLMLADAGVSVLAILAAVVTAQHTHSLGLSCWAYFFVQSMVFFLPGHGVPNQDALRSGDRFALAQRNAERALARLQSNYL